MADVIPTPTPAAPKPVVTVKPTTPAAAPPAEHPELVQARALKAEADAKLAAAEKRARTYAAEVRKGADEKKGLGAKLSKLAEMEKRESQAKLNKSAYLKSLYGEDWYDQIIQEKMNGGAPSADTIALEVDKVREEFSKKFEAQAAEAQKQQAEAQQRQVQNELRIFTDSAIEFAKIGLKDYPILEAYGTEAQIGNAIVQRIRAEHDRTIKRDQDTGEILERGKILSLKEAADLIENELVGIAERAAANDKYRGRLTEKMKPASTIPGSSQLRRTDSPERRTLSNDLTATTPGRKPAASEDERMARAVAAYNANRRG
jgi:hypothetical protein